MPRLTMKTAPIDGLALMACISQATSPVNRVAIDEDVGAITVAWANGRTHTENYDPIIGADFDDIDAIAAPFIFIHPELSNGD